jgi:hypothetical protein
VFGRYLVLINNRPADLRNWPGLADKVLNDALFWWHSRAQNYAKTLIERLNPAIHLVEIRKV